MKTDETPHYEMTSTNSEYGSWSSVQPTSEPLTAERLNRTKTRGFPRGEEPQTIAEAEAEIARLEQELAQPQEFSETISVWADADGTQTRSLSGTTSTGLLGKKGFNKNTDFSIPIDYYSKTKWKDI